MSTKTRSPERTGFLTDILITAVEGGINSWAYVRDYVHTSEDPSKIGVTVSSVDEDEDDFAPTRVDLDMIASAVRKITSGEVGVHERMFLSITHASNKNDTCPVGDFDDLDADYCDTIFQVALFGKVIYG